MSENDYQRARLGGVSDQRRTDTTVWQRGKMQQKGSIARKCWQVRFWQGGVGLLHRDWNITLWPMAYQIQQRNGQCYLSLCGAETYKLICNLVALEKPTACSFEQLKEHVQNHHNSKLSVIMELLHFNTCIQQPGESIAALVA